MRALRSCWKPARESSRPRWLAALTAVWLCLAGTQLASLRAAGREVPLNGHDLRISVDTRWAGCSHGGYYPIRIRATNVGPARELTFAFQAAENLPSVSRTLKLEQNATTTFSLAVPLVGRGSSGILRVLHDGKRLENMETGISFTDADSGAFDRPALLAIANDPLGLDEFENGVNALSAGVSSSSSYSYGRGSSRSSDHQQINPTMLPDRWIDYSGLDIVAVPLDIFEKLPVDTRLAILGWTRTGGNLLIYDVKESPEASARLAKLLELDVRAGAADWTKPATEQRQIVPNYQFDPYGNPVHESATYEIGPEGVSTTPVPPGAAASNEFRWGNGNEAFAMHPYLQGTVIAFRENPFPGSRHEWAWLLNTLGPERFQWTKRMGMSARHENSEFTEFLIPGISGVPVLAFLVLITLFSIGIGPVNYFFLAKRKRLHLLVLTIPIIAIFTSLSLFGYSIIAHGFDTKSRQRSVTVVDQRLQKSITYGRVSLYAGLAPSGGLSFDPETAVLPIWPNTGGPTFDSGSVDWTQRQSLESGWLKSRTRTQFATVTYADQRERLQISVGNDAVDVVNGFPYGFKSLLLSDDKGRLFYGEKLGAGQTIRLVYATPEQVLVMNADVQAGRPSGSENSVYYSSRNYRYDYYNDYAQFQASFRLSQTEKLLPDLSSIGRVSLPPNTYFGILSENPGVPTGLSNTTEVTGSHLLLGRY